MADIMTEAIVKIGLLDPPQRMRETAWKFECYNVLLQVECVARSSFGVWSVFP